MPEFKPAYLIHGSDHGRIAERRAKLRELAQEQGGVAGVEVFEGEKSTPQVVVDALAAITFALGRRFLIVDGVERWKDKELKELESVLTSSIPETTVAFFAREEGRLKAPAKLHAAVKKAGGDISTEQVVKPWELPRWLVAQAKALGLKLDSHGAALIIQRVGDRQQQLLRELEKLELAFGGGLVTAEQIEAITTSNAEEKVWELADTLVAGNCSGAIKTYLRLRAQGEQLGGLLYWMTQRVSLAHNIAQRIEDGESPLGLKGALRMPPKAAEQFIANVQRTGSKQLRSLILQLANLELCSRGGGSGLAMDTEVIQMLSKPRRKLDIVRLI